MYYYGDVKAVENLHVCINVSTVVSKALKMSRLIARIKILPSEADTDLDEVISKLKSTIPNGMGLERYANGFPRRVYKKN